MRVEKPILFSTPMVQAILEGRKTQTRRVIKPKFQDSAFDYYRRENALQEKVIVSNGLNSYSKEKIWHKPKYQPGDVLWVRETWLKHECEGLQREDRCYNVSCDCHYVYRADYAGNQLFNNGTKWKPSIHMPKEAARIFSRVTDVRAERVQDISNEDAIAEGIYEVRHNGWYWCDPATTKTPNCSLATTPRQAYMWLWQILNDTRDGGIYRWERNPWVWGYTFERVGKLEDFLREV